MCLEGPSCGWVGTTRLYSQVIGPSRVTGPYCTQRPGWAASAALGLHAEGFMLTLPLLDCFTYTMGWDPCGCQDMSLAAPKGPGSGSALRGPLPGRACLAPRLHAPLSGHSLSRDSQSKASHGHSLTTKRVAGESSLTRTRDWSQEATWAMSHPTAAQLLQPVPFC